MGVRWRLWGRTILAPPRPAWSSSATALTTGAQRARRCRSASARFWALPGKLRRPSRWLRKFGPRIARILADFLELRPVRSIEFSLCALCGFALRSLRLRAFEFAEQARLDSRGRLSPHGCSGFQA